MFTEKELQVLRRVFEAFVGDLTDDELREHLGLTMFEYDSLMAKLSKNTLKSMRKVD